MVIESPQSFNDTNNHSGKTNISDQKGGKRVSLRNLYADKDVEEEDEQEEDKTYLMKRLPLHFACSIIPDEKFGSMSDDAKLEELILKMIDVDPALCKRGDNEGQVMHTVIRILLIMFPNFCQKFRLSE